MMGRRCPRASPTLNAVVLSRRLCQCVLLPSSLKGIHAWQGQPPAELPAGAQGGCACPPALESSASL